MSNKLIKNADDIACIKAQMASRMALRDWHGKDTRSGNIFDIMLCMGTSCISSGAAKLKLIDEHPMFALLEDEPAALRANKAARGSR